MVFMCLLVNWKFFLINTSYFLLVYCFCNICVFFVILFVYVIFRCLFRYLCIYSSLVGLVVVYLLVLCCFNICVFIIISLVVLFFVYLFVLIFLTFVYLLADRLFKIFVFY